MTSATNLVWFIDTNVLSHWVLGKGGVLRNLVDTFNLANEFFDIYYNRYKEPIDLIDEVLRRRSEDRSDEFFISHLAISELFSALRDELRSIIMFKKGVPISRWKDPSNNPEMTPEHYNLIYTNTLQSFDILFKDKNIESIDEQSPESNPEYLNIYSSILFRIRDSKTQDSILLTTAILNEADYFVTKDDKLIRSAKDFIKDTYDTELINPSQALQILRKKV